MPSTGSESSASSERSIPERVYSRSMIPPVIEGFVVDGPLPSSHPRVSRWLLGGDGGEAYVGGEALLERARHLPTWGPFASVRIVDESAGAGVVVVPGRLERPLAELARHLTPGARVALAWHVAAQIAQLHENGAAHGAIDGQSVGLDEAGKLHARPALHLVLDGDQTATAQAHDCFLLGRVFVSLRLEETGDKNVALVLQGLQGERIRLAPGWAVRQALMAILVRHPEWEVELVEELGETFRLDALDDVEPLPTPRAPRAEIEDELSLEADDGGAEDPPTAPSFGGLDGPWAAFPVAEEDLPHNADEVTDPFPRAVEPGEPPGKPPEPERPAPKDPGPREPEEEPGAPVPETPPQLPDEEPDEAPEPEEPVRDPDEAPPEEPVEEPNDEPQEQPDGRLAESEAATAEEADDEPSFDVLDLVPPDAPEVSFIGLGRTSELEGAWREIADGDSPWVNLVAVPPEVEPPEEDTPVPEEVDVAALVASVAAAVDELPPIEDRWAVEIPRIRRRWCVERRKPSSRRSRRSPWLFRHRSHRRFRSSCGIRPLLRVHSGSSSSSTSRTRTTVDRRPRCSSRRCRSTICPSRRVRDRSCATNRASRAMQDGWPRAA